MRDRHEHNPAVWYIAAGYKLPAGIEAYLLHYATEIRNHGFAPRIIVFEPLPRTPHRFLVALRERRIPIESLYERVKWRARVACTVTYAPWWIRQWRREQTTDLRPQTADRDQPRFTVHAWASLLAYWTKRLAVRELRCMITEEQPDIVHVKGRIICEALAVLPSDRTVYQHALMGTKDPSWTDGEATAFSLFLNRIARVLVQGKGIAKTFAEAFNIRRPIDVVFTMAPDEVGGQWTVNGEQCSVRRTLRFGILCRFTEQKGIVYVLEALRCFKAKRGEVDFTFAGQGPMEEVIRETVNSWQWTGGRPQTVEERSVEQKDAKGAKEELLYASGVRIVPVITAVDILKRLDVFVHPGLDDAMPVSIVEALMCGVPCIVSNVGASPELVRDGLEGAVIEPASAAQICAAMERFAQMSEGDMADYKARARQRYEEACSPQIVGAQVVGIYRNIAGKR